MCKSISIRGDDHHVATRRRSRAEAVVCCRAAREMVLGLTDGQSLTAFIADPMICSHVIRQRQQQPPRPEEDHLTSLAASVARQRNDENFLLRLVLLCTSVA